MRWLSEVKISRKLDEDVLVKLRWLGQARMELKRVFFLSTLTFYLFFFILLLLTRVAIEILFGKYSAE
jgi:hypothetical protein